MRRTVLQQGDKLGTIGDTGKIGATGGTGAAGEPRNILVVEGIFTWQLGSPYYSLAKTYIIEKGETDFWIASGSHIWTADANVSIMTITNILQDDTKKFDVFSQQNKFTFSTGAPFLNQGTPLYVSIVNTGSASNGTIELRIVRGDIGSPVRTWQSLGSLYNGGEFKFSLMILGEAS